VDGYAGPVSTTNIYLYKQSINMTESQKDLGNPLTCPAFHNFVDVSICHRIPGLKLESQHLRAYLAMSGTESCVETVFVFGV
jgi:hypothetical protein